MLFQQDIQKLMIIYDIPGSIRSVTAVTEFLEV
jgi:hypothetical protein